MQKKLLCMDFESWVVSSVMNKKNLKDDVLRKLDEEYTRKSLEFVLAKLKKHNQKITFFLVFKLEDLFPGLIERILKDGHEIGWHSYTHSIIDNDAVLITEIENSKKLLQRYNIKGFQAPEIKFYKKGYLLLKKYGFTYSSSIYGNTNCVYTFNDIREIPVSVSNNRYKPKEDEVIFPSSLTASNLRKFHVPYGSSYFWSILGKKYYQNKLDQLERAGEKCNLFIHNWQLVHPNSASYKSEYGNQTSIFSNPLFMPYNVNITPLFDYLISSYRFQRCDQTL